MAIKEYLPSEFSTRISTQTQVTVYSGDKEKQFQDGIKKMLEEARRLAQLEANPEIVQILDCFEANGTFYIVMELLKKIFGAVWLYEFGTGIASCFTNCKCHGFCSLKRNLTQRPCT